MFYSAINNCNTELLLKFSSLLPEIAVHEKSVDLFIELLRKDQVNTSYIYMYNIYINSLKYIDKLAYEKVVYSCSNQKYINFSWMKPFHRNLLQKQFHTSRYLVL